MKTISLTQGFEAIVDDDDYEWLSRYRWQIRHSSAPGNPSNAKYASGRIDKVHRLMHRLIMDNPASQVDHINGNGLDNRRSNLRLATSSQNRCNIRLRADNTSGFKGVSWHKLTSKWMATAGPANHPGRYLGLFDDPVEAARAYDKAALELFGEFAKLNGV